MSVPRKYDPAYRETLCLPVAGDLRIRLLRHRDRTKLYEGFLSLSAETRYRRFHYPKNDLSSADLEFFSNLDGLNHLALAAFRLRNGREVDLVGVARFLRLAPSSDVAEVAVTVRDEFQGRGLGKALLARLVESASERGIRWLRFYLLNENRPARSLLEHSVWETTFENQGTLIAAELEVPQMIDEGPTGHLDFHEKMEDLIRMIARGAVASPFSLSLLGLRSWRRETGRVVDRLTTDD